MSDSRFAKYPPEAIGLRPVRFARGGELEYWDAVIFDENAHLACGTQQRRLVVFGGIAEEKQNEFGLIDVLDKDFDVIDNIAVNAKGFRYFVSTFNLSAEEDDSIKFSREDFEKMYQAIGAMELMDEALLDKLWSAIERMARLDDDSVAVLSIEKIEG